MKAIVCSAPGEIQLQDAPVVDAKEGEILVSIKRIGICGTDYHIYQGKHPFLSYPLIIGHELSGLVSSESKSSKFSPGEKVLINPYIACGKCSACRKQKPNCCSNIQVLGVHRNGGMCETLAVPESQVYSAEGLSLDDAAMVEFLAIGAHGVRRAEIKADDKVLIVGAGPIGLGTAIFAKNSGAHVSILDRDTDRVHAAKNIIKNINGYTMHEAVENELYDSTNQEWFDVVFDATGNSASMETSIKYTGHGGTCVFISVVNDDIRFHDPLFHSRELKLVGSRNATEEDFQRVIDCLKTGSIATEKLLTHKTSLELAGENIPKWAHDKTGLIKAVVSI